MPGHRALTAKEKQMIYEQGLVGILKQLHDELDAAVAEAYGWPCPGPDPNAKRPKPASPTRSSPAS